MGIVWFDFNFFFFFNHDVDIEEFQNLGYRAAVSKDESSSLLKKVKDGDQQIHSNFLVSRYAQNALTGKLFIFCNY